MDDVSASPRCKVPAIIEQPLWDEAKNAIKMSLQYKNFENFREALCDALHYNSSQTRARYATNIIKWFFPEKKLDTLPAKVWKSYRDDAILQQIMRYQYLSVEQGVAKFVTETIIALDPGDIINSNQIKNFAIKTWGLNESYALKATKRIRSALLATGFIANKGGNFVVQEIEPPKTALLILTHHLFAQEPQTITIKEVLKNPYWKYLGIRKESTVREIFKEASYKGVISRYVVADELEQITTKYSLEELLRERVRL